MNAADVLTKSRRYGADRPSESLVHDLLAHGEQGVAILPDGTLWKLQREVGYESLFTLVPISAEAGDTGRCQWRPTPKSVHQCELPEGHEGHHRAVATQRTGW
jgi:hypothetical protein